MKQKTIAAFVLTVALIFGGSTLSFALQANEDASMDVTRLEPIVSNLLEMAKLESDCNGLSNVNFDNLCLGEKIPAYKADEKNLEELNIDYYPILENDTIVAMATVTYAPDGSPSIQLGKGMADKLQEFTEYSNSVALVYDESGENLYACDDESNYDVVNTYEIDSEANDLNEDTDLMEIFDEGQAADINFTQIEPTVVLDVDQNTNSNSTTSFLSLDNTNLLNADSNVATDDMYVASSTTDSANLSVPKVGQGSYNICWAADDASIGEYKTGKSYTAKKVCTKMGIDYETTTGAAINVAAKALRDIYGLSTITSNSAPTFSKIQKELKNGDPIWAGFKSGKLGHAVVIRAFAYGTGYKELSYMNSGENNGNGSYTYAYFTDDGVYSFDYAGYTFTCKSYIFI